MSGSRHRPEAEWEMLLFKNEELINYLTAFQVNKSVYEYVQYDSEVEREFAQQLDQREDIKLFVKLPGWFVIDTPVGTYNPDWAILKARRPDALSGARNQGDEGLSEAAHQRGRQGPVRTEALRSPGFEFEVVVSAEDI